MPTTSWEPLIEITRGPLVECLHQGRIVVADARGRVLHALGDPRAPVYARSALKPFQALPVLASGAADAFAFGAEELALLCASHSGEPQHTARVARMLERIGCGADDLQCGCHPPLYLNPGDPPPAQGISTLHHNCSGKHSGFLAYCRHCRLPVADYLDPGNRLQRDIRSALAACAGIAEEQLVAATDGCSAPTYALPLAGLARAYALLADGGDEHLERLFRAMTSHPELVSGTGRSDMFYMSRRPGDIVAKVGADGVQAIGVRSRGIGIALKIADGSPRAAAAAAAAVLIQLGFMDACELDTAPAILAPQVRNARDIVTGEVRAAFRLR
jgi:L-asparaginase II